MGYWDDIIKLFISENAQDLVTWLWRGARVKEKLLTEFKLRTIQADSVLELELEDDGTTALFHIEIQSTRDPDIGERLLRYSYEAKQAHHLPVYSCVIYLRDVGEVPQPPLRWPRLRGRDILEFHYQSVELSKVSTQELRETGLIGLLPLLILTQNGATYEVMEEVVAELGAVRQPDLLSISKMFASLVFKSSEDQQWIERLFAMSEDILSESWVYQKILKQGIEKGREEGIEKGREEGIEKGREEGIEKGREEGIEKGREEGIEKGREEGEIRGLQKALVSVVESRFPPLKDLAQEKVIRSTKPDALDLVLKGVLIAPDEEHARFLLETLAA